MVATGSIAFDVKRQVLASIVLAIETTTYDEP
jgi:hypothetical protein